MRSAWSRSLKVRVSAFSQLERPIFDPATPVLDWKTGKDKDKETLVKMYVGLRSAFGYKYHDCSTLKELSERLRQRIEAEGTLPDGYDFEHEAFQESGWEISETS